jgi:hypothetical protein
MRGERENGMTQYGGARQGGSNRSDNLLDRRTGTRYPADREALAVVTGNGPDVRLPARIYDISRHGIRLLLKTAVETGTILNVELESPTEGIPCFLLARVAWTEAQPDGTYGVGCRFSRPLKEHELRSLL